MPLAHLVEVNALTMDGPEGPCLSASWSWAGALLCEPEVRALAEGWQRALEALVHHVARPGAGGHTPSDFPLVALSAEQVEQLEGAYPGLEDILPLSPLQEGLHFHALYDGARRMSTRCRPAWSLRVPLMGSACEARWMRWCTGTRTCAPRSATRGWSGPCR